MPTYIVRCKACGKEHEPSPEAIRAGTWKLCPDCTPKPTEPSRCRECSRILRTPGRTICLSCLGVPAL
jgi:hypothetical protein